MKVNFIYATLYFMKNKVDGNVRLKKLKKRPSFIHTIRYRLSLIEFRASIEQIFF